VKVVAGLAFSFEPEEALDPRERDALGDARAEAVLPTAPAVRIRLEPRVPGATPAPKPPPGPAEVSWDGSRLRLSHAAFDAEIDVAAGTAVVRREPDSAAGLVTTVRTALAARLPLEGGVLLHAAALAHRGRTFVFFGPSGIGKSTLAQRSPWPVLSDELVAVLPVREAASYRVAGAALPPGPSDRSEPSAQPRLAALVELAQGPRFLLDRLDARTALRRLLGSIAVPAAPPLWAAAVGVAADVARRVPCYRMAWSLDESPFEPLAAALWPARARESGDDLAETKLSSGR
jgi:hypothetical protein